jgi:antitoxin StbD
MLNTDFDNYSTHTVIDRCEEPQETLRMGALLDRADQAVSATSMVRSFGARLKEVSSGEVAHLVIFKDNEPAAVLIGIDAYQSLQDELEDLRSELLAIERIARLDMSNTVSLEDMEVRFS